jgi:3-phenylpropionate/trans-cinnamate dioxygenase ferredoxin reductase subunit
MPVERIVIVGGGPAGFATARSYRERGGGGEVTLVGDESRLPYERPPLSKEFLRGTREAAELTLERQEWFDDHEVELCLGVSATAADPRRGTVTVADGRELRADAIVFATGSAPIRLSVPGADHPDVQTFRTLEDSERLALRATPGQRVLVIGSGFIGCEIAGSLAMRGIAATLIAQEPLPHHERLGPQAAERIAGWLGDLDVELVGEAPVVAIHGGREVELEEGRRIEGGCVVLAAGARPRGNLAAEAGLAMHDGALVVDAALRASNGSSGVLAVGDVAYAYNTTARRHLRVEHWGDALAHGEVAGHTLATGAGQWDGVPGFWSTIGERTLKYAAWGDGHDACRLVEHADGAFTIWYQRDGTTVGVLTHERDEDYEQGRELIAKGEPPP